MIGKTPVLKETLIMLHNGTKIKLGINLSSLIGILTGPGHISKHLNTLAKMKNHFLHTLFFF